MMKRRLNARRVLLAFWLACLVRASVAAPIPVLPAAQYRRELLGARDQLGRSKPTDLKALKTLLHRLDQVRDVVRADGQKQRETAIEWHRRLGDLSGRSGSTGSEMSALRQAVAQRLQALDEWTTPHDGAYYQAADAQGIVSQLQSTGQIRYGPTRWEQGKSDFWKWLRNLFNRGGGAPAAPRLPAQSGEWAYYLFLGITIALCGVVLWFALRFFAQYVGVFARGAKRKSAFAGSEDEELLLLPPDELRERARKFARDGDFPQALRHLYIAVLLELDARGLWRYDARRTNWEHISALRRSEKSAPIVEPLSSLTRRFDRVRYGNAPCTSHDWSQFEADVARLETDMDGARQAVEAGVA